MVLVDTSIWIRHLRLSHSSLVHLLQDALVCSHPFVMGELACGNLQAREELLDLISRLPSTEVANHDEVMEFLKRRKLFGHGIGWVDAHLLCSALISGVKIYSSDKSMSKAAKNLGICWSA